MTRASLVSLLGAFLFAACTYDFDAPFAGSDGSTASVSSSAGAGGAGGAATTAASTSTTAAATTGTGGSGGAPAEDCGNGDDDDGDSFVDCADPDCGAYGCTEAPPADWIGPVALYVGDPASRPPPCDAAWPARIEAGIEPLVADPAACSPCGCDPPSGAMCGNGILHVFDSGACGTEEDAISGVPNVCTPFTTTDVSSSLRGNDAIVSNGTCAPIGGELLSGPAAWTQQAVVCSGAAIGAGCPSVGDVCVPRPAPPFGAKLCVQHDGDVPCPGAYTQKTVVFDDIDDTRDCSACVCGAPGGGLCTGVTSIFQNGNCQGAATATVPHNATCVPVFGDTQWSSLYDPGVPRGASCNVAPGGAQASGTAVGAVELTICCVP